MSMPCLYCGKDAHVVDSRYKADYKLVRRRYLCLQKKCAKRWTTVEVQSDEWSRDARNTAKSEAIKIIKKQLLGEITTWVKNL